ncbi:MAG: response regulator transcription factor [Clostridiales bacterium]|nr:response regulator transcription factor [Clostridiales bacterium]
MLNIAIVDDEQAEFKQIESCFLRFAESNEDDKFNIKWYPDALDFLDDYQSADIVFMDIEMPHLSGIEAAERLRGMGCEIPLVFVTNMAQYALKGYEVNAVDYILKPVNYTRFSSLLKKIIRNVKESGDVGIFIKVPGGTKRLNASEILFVEIRDHLLVYHTLDQKTETWSTLKEAEKTLPEFFVRCNHGYIVNLKHITAVVDDTIVVADGKANIPISRSKKKEFLAKFNRYTGLK